LIASFLLAVFFFGVAIRSFFVWHDALFATWFIIGGCGVLVRWVLWPLWSRSANRSAKPS
jgi:hypothetical protein